MSAVSEIAAKFNRMMRPGGRIDQILNGAAPGEKKQKLSDAEADRILTNLEIQLREYKQELNEAASWYQRWKARQPKGFRAIRR